MVAILERGPVPVATRRPDASRELEAVVMRCLEKEPGRRYESAPALMTALQAVAAAKSRTAAAADDSPSVAVLPFANMSADPENEYFCDGIAEEITGALSKVERLRVAGRTSAFSFKGKTGDVREIGRALNVSTVLEGSVRKAGNRLRISAQLVKVTGGEKAAVLTRSTENPEAYNLCLKARHAWTRWTDEGFRTAIALF